MYEGPAECQLQADAFAAWEAEYPAKEAAWLAFIETGIQRAMALMDCEMNQMAPMHAIEVDVSGTPLNHPGLSRLQDRHSKIRSKMDTANKLIIEVAAIIKDQSK